MASVIRKETVEICIKLNLLEAQYLKGLVQNSFVEDERPEDTEKRKSIWDALHAAGVSLP